MVECLDLSTIYNDEFTQVSIDEFVLACNGFFEEEKIAEIVKEMRVRIDIHGDDLVPVRLDLRHDATDKLEDYFSQSNLIGHKIFSGRRIDRIEVLRYSPMLIMLETMFDDLNNVNFAEVGPNKVGLGFLGYISTMGVSVVAVDRAAGLRKIAEELQVPFINGRWENLSDLLGTHDFPVADVIFVNSMHPYPWKRGRPLPVTFEEHVSDEVIKSLSPQGIYVQIACFGDYFIHGIGFIEQRFKKYSFNLGNGYEMDVFQR